MVKIIAEIGWNHCGDMTLAKQMIKAAADNGATYAKFQTWSVNRLKQGPWDTDGRREIYIDAELTKDKHAELIEYCKTCGIEFLSSVFSIPDAQLLHELGVREVKIPSFESRNIDLIKYCDASFTTVYMSTGTSTYEEIRSNTKFMTNANWYLLHCVSSYPCLPENANIHRMIELSKLGYDIGYSDHIEGVESAKVAVMLGATVIEKHFTIDNELPGRDNKFAILPKDLKALHSFITLRDNMMLRHGLDFQPCEFDARNIYTSRFNKDSYDGME
jgi:N,N'-diacetyllegionaminate synthase